MNVSMTVLVAGFVLSIAPAAIAATTAQEKAFVDAHRKAFESKDAKGLHALLYTKGADPHTLAPVTKLVIKRATKGASGSSSFTVFVADADGRLVIPVRGPAR